MKLICLTTLPIILLISQINLYAAEITGRVLTQDGEIVPSSLGPISVFAIQGDYTTGINWTGSSKVNPSDGSYRITDIPAGLYHLVTQDNSHILDECWALPESVWVDYVSVSGPCLSVATPVLVAEEEIITDKDFRLDIGTSSISGTVYRSDGVTPVSGGTIRASSVQRDGTSLQFGAFRYFPINSNGTYTISHLPSGEYQLLVSAADRDGEDYLDVWWGAPASVIDQALAASILISDDEDITGKDFTLQRGASISGTVYNSDGSTPMIESFQDVIVFKSENPCIEETLVAHESVDLDDGTYSIQQLTAGTYYLKTWPFFHYFEDFFPNISGGYWSSSGTVYDCSEATPIIITSNQVVTGKDFQFSTGATISGTLFESDGVTPLSSGSAMIYDQHPCSSSQALDYRNVYDSGGTFSFNRLKEGQYYISARRTEYMDQWWTPTMPVSNCSQAIPITVEAGESISNIDIVFNNNTTISGTIFKNDGSTPIIDRRVYLTAYPNNPCSFDADDNSVWNAKVVSSSGSYTLAGLSSGTYYIRAKNVGDLMYNNEWWSSNGSTTDCSAATPIVITTPKAITDINFELSYRFAMPGDLNLDGRVELYDAIVALQTLTGRSEHAASPASDVNDDYKVGVHEAITILQTVSE